MRGHGQKFSLTPSFRLLDGWVDGRTDGYTHNLQKHRPVARCLWSISGLFLCASNIGTLHQSEFGLFLNSLTDFSQRSNVLILEA